MQVYWEAALRLSSSLAPRTEARKVTRGKSGEGEEKERKGTAQREGKGDGEGMGSKCLDYVGKSHWEKGSPVFELESSGLGQGMPGRD